MVDCSPGATAFLWLCVDCMGNGSRCVLVASRSNEFLSMRKLKSVILASTLHEQSKARCAVIA